MPATRVLVGWFTASVCFWTGRSLADGCPGDPNQSIGPDIVVADITLPANYIVNGTREAMSFGSDACNLGDQEVLWESCPDTTHPVFGSNLYRWSLVSGATRFEQVGQSWLKHGVGAEQGSTCCANCQPGSFTSLGRGCSDMYTAQQAADQSSLGPKYLVNAHTGVFPSGMCGVRPSGGNTGRLEVEVADLVATNGGASADVRYYTQIQYITADDAAAHNQNNNASSREVAVSGSGFAWNFSLAAGGVTQVKFPGIRVWTTIDSGVVASDINTPEDDGFPGMVIVAAKATDLGDGFWHYEYAVNNLNSDRSIGAFAVPCSIYATVSNIGFHDVAYRGGDGLGGLNYDGADWPGSFANGAVRWSTTPFAANPNANAIRWGTLYNFRFDANVPPAPAGGDVWLTQFKVVTDVVAASIVPGMYCVKGDMNGDGLVDGGDVALFVSLLFGGGGTPAQRCAGDVQATPDGMIDGPDVDPFVNCVLDGGCL